MVQYHLFHSEAQQYAFIIIGISRAKEIAKNLVEAVKKAPKIDEAVALLLGYNNSYYNNNHLPEHETVFAIGIHFGRLELKTEQLYIGEGGQLMSYGNLPALASFKRQNEEVLFRIHSIPQIGVDPAFLYNFGKKYGRKL